MEQFMLQSFTPNGSSIEIETPNEAATSVEQRIISQD